MANITSFIDIARDHVKSDGDDDNLLTQYANSAVGVATGFCRRSLYWDQTVMDADKATFLDKITAVENAWQTAKDTYAPKCDTDPIDRYYADWHPLTAQDRINYKMLNQAWRTYVAALSDLKQMTDGILIDDTILAALLLITGHLYRNRQEVISQAGAVAIQLPMGAQRILEPYMAV